MEKIMLDDAIEIITKMMIEEHLKIKSSKKYVITKTDLYKFCIKLLKTIKKY